MEFKDFRDAVSKQFQLLAMSTDMLFTTSGADLWDCYLASFPEDERQSHNCNCCRHFIRHYGNIVSIVNNKVVSIWDNITVDAPFDKVVANLAIAAKACPIMDVFVCKLSDLGTSRSNVMTDGHVYTWHHLSAVLPKPLICKSALSVESVAGTYRTTQQVFKRSVEELTIESVETVLELIGQKSLYRGEEFELSLTQFKNLKADYNKLSEEEKDNWCWANFSKAGHVARIRNTAIGTLLVDISSGLFELDECVSAYERMVAPTNYKRPTTIATKSMIAAAEATAIELGIVPALPRKHAIVTDITVNNVIYANRNAKAAMAGSVFDELATSAPVNAQKLGKLTEISIEDFIANVVPTATSIEVLMEGRLTNNLMTLTAPVDKSAKHLFKWPNNFAWTYNGDVADSIKEKVRDAGGNVNGVLRCSLAWSNGDDLDIHVYEPSGNEISFNRKISGSSGTLDVDMNAGGPHTRKPVENIVWTDENRMKEGIYTLKVHNFSLREHIDCGFGAEIECKGVIHQFEYPQMVTHKQTITVAQFKWSREKGVELISGLPSSALSQDIWGISTSQYQKVSLMMLSPNHWDGNGIGNKHYFFILDGCKNPNKVRGFFNEYLHNDLNPHRKTFEMLADKMKVPFADNQLSGVGFSSTVRNSIVCKVEGAFTRTLRINF